MFACIHVPHFSAGAHAALLDCAGAFSPRVENTAPGTVVFDLEGLERLFGSYSEIAQNVAAHVCAAGIQEAHVAVASNPDAAVTAARGFTGVTVLARGTEEKKLQDLPLDVLAPSPEILETLGRWGIRTIGAFRNLPAVEISQRFGQEGVRLHMLARGAASRPLVPHQETLRFIEVMELDYEIGTVEPLAFILLRMLDQICSRLGARNLATHEIHLSLGIYGRVLRLPVPVRNPKLLAKLLLLDLEAHPPGAPIHQVKVEAVPSKPRIVQNGLFVPLSPDPEKLELTLARIAAVVGEENVGSPEVLDTYRPDAFQVKKFRVPGHFKNFLLKTNEGQGELPSLDKEGWLRPLRKCREASLAGADGVVGSNYRLSDVEQTTPSAPSKERDHLFDGAATPPLPRRGVCLSRQLSQTPEPQTPVHALTLRRFRPPFEATVQLRNTVPIWIAFPGVHGSIEKTSGPWRSSGDWWRPNTWDREEWDIQVNLLNVGPTGRPLSVHRLRRPLELASAGPPTSAVYRIYYDVHTDRWFAEGVYD